tara:strand:- start:306 stop:698 length:393 start_codon:yes stop_codon:yes gene_type:complete
MATPHTDESIRKAQRKFAPVWKAFLQQWPTQYERQTFAKEACGQDWLGSHAVGFESEHSCIKVWTSDKPKVSAIGIRFWIAMEEMNKAARDQGFTPMTFKGYGQETLPTATEFLGAFNGTSEPVCFVITQ